MMQGRVKSGRASVPITFRLSNQPDFQIEFVVDTGYLIQMFYIKQQQQRLSFFTKYKHR